MIKRQWTLLFAAAIVFSGCTNDATLRQKADELAHKYIITDGHVDIPFRLANKMEDVSVDVFGVFKMLLDLRCHDLIHLDRKSVV